LLFTLTSAVKYARIIQVQLLPESVTGATEYFRDSVGPALKQQAGFANSRALFNGEANKCLLVTLWETAEARSASETNGFL
jgi:hypothetical protein